MVISRTMIMTATVALLMSCASSKQTPVENVPTSIEKENSYKQWRYDNGGCVFKKAGCRINFQTVTDIKKIQSWVIAFRTGGSKNNSYNLGFSLGEIDGEQALICTQSDTRDPGNNRRTEAKVALAPVGDYRITFDLYVDQVPRGYDATISQIKCGSGKPPVNIKMTDGGGVRVKSGGKHALSRTPGYFKKGWHSVVYTIENSKKAISLSIDGRPLNINQNNVVTDCRDIRRAGKDYYLKIGLYEDDIVPDFWIGYKNLTFTDLRQL